MKHTVFDWMSGLARQHGAINLGQGFPDGPVLEPLLEAAQRALRDRSNQYAPGAGLPELRNAICGYYQRRQGLGVQFEDVTVTSGATEALASALLALVNPGDEVIIFQPAYDAYAPMVRRAGGVPVAVSLDLPTFSYPLDRLESVITPRTRLLMLNDPLNPAGTVASLEELERIAQLCRAHNLIAICDEVWEDVRFDGKPHRSLMAFPGMAERTVKIGSAGKIFGITGWKIGWMIASGALGTALARAHQFLTYASAPPLQWAVAEGLTLPDALLDEQRGGWANARERLRDGLRRAGFHVLPNAATWFLNVDLGKSGVALRDEEFCEQAVTQVGVAAIPVSAFYEGEQRPRDIVRFCFTKPAEMLDEALSRLAHFRQILS